LSARFIVGDVFEVLASLPENSVDLCFSSPPFLALRSYLPAEHPQKHLEIGSEATPADFLDTLLDVVEACDRVLAPHGSLCFELGDTFSGSGGAGGDYGPDGLREGQPKFRAGTPRWDGRPEGQVRTTTSDPVSYPARARDGWPLDKSLCGIPTLFAWSLAYGRNLLRPERETPRWRIRNLVVWARPNPPVGALGDKFRPATSYLTVATKSRSRYFDLDAVRHEHKDGRTSSGGGSAMSAGVPRGATGDLQSNPAGAPPLDYWVLPTAPYKGSHYATFPPELVVKPVKAMTPLRVCRVCGEPSRRITGQPEEYAQARAATREREAPADSWDGNVGNRAHGFHSNAPERLMASTETLGWTECDCSVNCPTCSRHDHGNVHVEKWRAGTVLDPFAGSGTTLAVATGHGRDAIGVDLDERNAELALERVGPMFLEIVHLNAEGAA
jgi:DNA modification methylase